LPSNDYQPRDFETERSPLKSVLFFGSIVFGWASAAIVVAVFVFNVGRDGPEVGFEGGDHNADGLFPPPELHIPGLLLRLDGDGHARADATGQLLKYATEEHLEALHEGIGGLRNGAARGRAAMVLAKIASEQSNANLTRMLEEDTSKYARRGAAYALGQIGSESSVVSLKHALASDEETDVRFYAANAILSILGSDAASTFQDVLSGDSLPAKVREELERMSDPLRMGTRAPDVVAGRSSRGVLNDGEYKIYVPSRYTSKKKWPVVVSIHARNEPWEDFESMWRVDAEKHGFIVLAPHFDEVNYPSYEWMVGLARSSDAQLLSIIDQLGEVASIQSEQFYLFGHSTGGKFVSSFSFLYPERVAKAAMAGANGFTSPDPKKMFVAGILPNPGNHGDAVFDVKKVFDTPMVVLLRLNERKSRRNEAVQFKSAMDKYATQIGTRHHAEILELPSGGDVAALYAIHAGRFFFDEL